MIAVCSLIQKQSIAKPTRGTLWQTPDTSAGVMPVDDKCILPSSGCPRLIAPVFPPTPELTSVDANIVIQYDKLVNSVYPEMTKSTP